jgi:hypothetical protein
MLDGSLEMNRHSTFAVLGDVRLYGVSNEKALDAVVPELRRLGVEAVVVCSAGGAVRMVPLTGGNVFHSAVGDAFAAGSSSVEVVRFGGSAFVLCNVKEMPANGAEILKNAGLQKNERFFYFQRKHPRGTCAGDFVAEQDGGISTRVLSAFPTPVRAFFILFGSYSYNGMLCSAGIKKTTPLAILNFNDVSGLEFKNVISIEASLGL